MQEGSADLLPSSLGLPSLGLPFPSFLRLALLPSLAFPASLVPASLPPALAAGAARPAFPFLGLGGVPFLAGVARERSFPSVCFLRDSLPCSLPSVPFPSGSLPCPSY